MIAQVDKDSGSAANISRPQGPRDLSPILYDPKCE